jgi:hypothetical protein
MKRVAPFKEVESRCVGCGGSGSFSATSTGASRRRNETARHWLMRHGLRGQHVVKQIAFKGIERERGSVAVWRRCLHRCRLSVNHAHLCGPLHGALHGKSHLRTVWHEACDIAAAQRFRPSLRLFDASRAAVARVMIDGTQRAGMRRWRPCGASTWITGEVPAFLERHRVSGRRQVRRDGTIKTSVADQPGRCVSTARW